ncbi:MAG TPA: carboxypeptidase-like regulatory domain-containing protein, partial [Bacteroidales bacterium]
MKLVKTVQYILKKRINKFIVGTILLSFLHFYTSNAQKFKLTFSNVPLSEALLQVSKQFDIKFAFDAKKLGAIIINKEVSGNSGDELITSLLSNTGLQFQVKHDRYLIIDDPESISNSATAECQLIGAVLDKESGEQLPFASVSLSNQNVNMYASENGTFCIKNVVPNPMHVVVSFIGYQPVDTSIAWDKPLLNCDFRLSRKVQKIDSVLVKGNTLDMIDYRNDVDFATTVNPSKLIDLPLLAETDIFKTLQLLPGIKYSENSSELSIRGGSSDQNLVLFDGQTLYNLSHYFGVFSSLNPNVIKDIQIYKGGYDSRYGERVSGILDITGKSGNQTRPTIYGDVNLINANLATEIPLSRKLTLIAAGRRSYSDIYSTSFADGLFEKSSDSYKGSSDGIVETTKPSFYFYDFDTKLTYRINNKENLSLSYYGGKDFYDNKYGGIDHSSNVISEDNNNWSNYGLSATWLKQWNGSFFSNLQLGTSGYSNEYTNVTLIKNMAPQDTDRRPYLPDSSNNFNMYDKNTLKDYSLSLKNIWYVNNNNQLDFGISERQNTIYYYKDANKLYVYNNTNQSSWLTSFYALDRISISGKFTIKPGLRASYYDGTGHFYLEPRFAANYRFSGKFSARFATGRYYQFISQVLSPQETGY